MAEPFVFHFRRGDDGQPEQMYLADIRAECGVCRHVQVQRFYHSSPLHSATAKVVERLARQVASKTDYECENCGSQVGEQHALSTAFTWAFPDDAGLIRAFWSDVSDASSLRWQFVAGRRLDPQELPGWQAIEGDRAYPTLDTMALEEVCGRVLSPKRAIREAVLDWAEDPDGGALASVCRDMTFLAAGPGASLEELAEELDPAGVVIELTDCVPTGLPTHRNPEALGGSVDGWFPEGVDRGALGVHVQSAVVHEGLERAFAVANLSFHRDEMGYHELTTPRGVVYPRSVPVVAVLRRAVYTGLTPGDAARLTAEEIIGSLLRVW